jgi:hypothetical protein
MDDQPPPPSVVFRGSARSGRMYAVNNPFGSLQITWQAATIRCWKFDSEVVRKGVGKVLLNLKGSRATVRFQYETGEMGRIVFKSSRASDLEGVLKSFGWEDDVLEI